MEEKCSDFGFSIPSLHHLSTDNEISVPQHRSIYSCTIKIGKIFIISVNLLAYVGTLAEVWLFWMANAIQKVSAMERFFTLDAEEYIDTGPDLPEDFLPRYAEPLHKFLEHLEFKIYVLNVFCQN